MYNIIHTDINFYKDGFLVGWISKGTGFGEITFQKNNGQLIIDSEFMQIDFVKEVLNHLLDKAVWDKENNCYRISES